MAALNRDRFRQIPKVDRLLEWPEMAPLLAAHPRTEVLGAVRVVLQRLRESLHRQETPSLTGPAVISAEICRILEQRGSHSLRRVINGTGVVVHTNLGRAPLAPSAQEAVRTTAGSYSNLEYDLETGSRGRRNVHVERLICELTGAEAALAVNNNAAAVLLALTSLAAGREVVISRGELVEIGGSFRIPDVMKLSGADLVEVGTTNRTHLRDYREAITERTALLLKVHTSNFAVVGFTAEVGIGELARLAEEHRIPLVLDAGSGCLADLSPFGIAGEATVKRHLEEGADLVTFSGDKLLGGPQAGIIAGRRDLVEPMKQHPLLRAFRMDKLSLAALETTLRLYRDERRALREIPVLNMLTADSRQLEQRAGRIIRRLRGSLPPGVRLARRQGESSPGGGSFPLLHLPTALIEVSIQGLSSQGVENALRRAKTAVIGRIHRGSFLLDVRTIFDDDLATLAESLAEAASSSAGEHQ